MDLNTGSYEYERAIRDIENREFRRSMIKYVPIEKQVEQPTKQEGGKKWRMKTS